jgi:tetratricopeptide (TPR) repeat protein
MGAADAEEEEESYQPMAAESLVRDPGLILDPDEPLTGDFLRSLSKPHLAMARLEMTWGQRANVEKWQKYATDVQRCWRGFRQRWYGEVRKDARDQRREALKFMTQARVILERRDPAELKECLELLKFAGRKDHRCGEIWSLRGEARYALGEFRKAREAFATAFDLLPERRRPVCQLGEARCAAAMGDYSGANDILGLMLEKEHTHRKPADLDAAERRFRASLTGEEDDGGRRTQDAARALRETRRRRAVAGADAPFAHARFLRGCVRAKLSDWRGAEVDFEKYLEYAPPELPPPSKMRAHSREEADLANQRARALTLLGAARGCNRNWSAAVARLTEGAQIEPNATRCALLGRVHACERQWLLAMDRYRDALDLDSTLEQARVGLDQVRIKHEPMPLVTGLI